MLKSQLLDDMWNSLDGFIDKDTAGLDMNILTGGFSISGLTKGCLKFKLTVNMVGSREREAVLVLQEGRAQSFIKNEREISVDEQERTLIKSIDNSFAGNHLSFRTKDKTNNELIKMSERKLVWIFI